MCVIMKFTDNYPTEDMLKSAEAMNSDGGGIAWIEGDEVLWEKGLHVKTEYIMDLIKKCKIQLPFIIHFRITTHGGTNDELCHPFAISAENFNKDIETSGKDKKGVLFHNGIWSNYDDVALDVLKSNPEARLPETGNLSDSRVMAWLVKYFGINYLSMIDEKVTVLTPQGIRTFGKGWTKVEGNMCSNDSFHHSYGYGWGGGYSSGGVTMTRYSPKKSSGKSEDKGMGKVEAKIQTQTTLQVKKEDNQETKKEKKQEAQKMSRSDWDILYGEELEYMSEEEKQLMYDSQVSIDEYNRIQRIKEMEEEITQLEEKSKGGKKEAQKEVEESYQAWLDKMHSDRKENRD